MAVQLWEGLLGQDFNPTGKVGSPLSHSLRGLSRAQLFVYRLRDEKPTVERWQNIGLLPF
jgi:hypothetical protein